MSLYWLGNDPHDDFPPVEGALKDPNGLLAAGGQLTPERLLSAYPRGIFPWYSEGQPLLWWSPDPRMVLAPSDFHVSRSLVKAQRRYAWRLTFNQAFEAVVDGCAAPRDDEPGTWITAAMRRAYVQLHRLGWAHSVEVWLDDTLVGGLYGIAIDRVFFGESMFSNVSNASKLALKTLCETLLADGFTLIDCQMHTAHLQSLGATLIDRRGFCQHLAVHCKHLKQWQSPTHHHDESDVKLVSRQRP